jgi:hypothetical protein
MTVPTPLTKRTKLARARGDAEAVSVWSCDLSALSRFGSDSCETCLSFHFRVMLRCTGVQTSAFDVLQGLRVGDCFTTASHKPV